MKRFYQSEDAYRSAHKIAFSGSIASKKIVTVRLPNLLAEVHVAVAGFAATAVVRHISIENIGVKFESIHQALENDAAFHWFKSKMAGSLSLPKDLTPAKLIGAVYGHTVCSSLEEALMHINTKAKVNSKDFIQSLDKTHLSVFTSPDENIIIDKMSQSGP